MLLTKTLLINDAVIKFADNNAARFSGYASHFGGVDTAGDTILKGAYKNVIESIKSTARFPMMFFNHNRRAIPAGKWLELAEDDTGLYVVGEFTAGNSEADMLKAALKHQTVDGLSIGARLQKTDFEQTDKGMLIKNISRLDEISIVSFPADDGARVDLMTFKSEVESISSVKEFEAFLREAGGFSKGLAEQLTFKSKQLFAGEPQALLDKSLQTELMRLINTPLL